MRVERIGMAELYLADCRDVLWRLDQVGAVVTDPPYGIGADLGAGKSAGKWSEFTGERRWDESPPDRDLLEAIIGKAQYSVLWGGNYFGLPPSSCWLVWDKETAGVTTFADCELAWTNIPKAVRMIRHLWSGPYMRVKETRYHPTQKPVRIMEWSIEQCPSASVVLDPFMGSGTTGVACANLGRHFIGIEADPRYFDIACERIEAAASQGRLFT